MEFKSNMHWFPKLKQLPQNVIKKKIMYTAVKTNTHRRHLSKTITLINAWRSSKLADKTTF